MGFHFAGILISRSVCGRECPKNIRGKHGNRYSPQNSRHPYLTRWPDPSPDSTPEMA